MESAHTGKVTCNLCPHFCSLDEGQRGICRARYAHDGAMVPESYGRITSLALDPIEKKPIACWNQGKTVLSLGSYGCNMACPFCQNSEIAAVGADGVPWREYTPERIVAEAQHLKFRNCIGIAYTYNEPFTFYEFMRDTSFLAHDRGLVNVVVSNGMINPEPLARLLPVLDAANIDLKCFTDDGYRKLGGNLEAVKRTIKMFAECETCHLEVTTLLVPGFNDNGEEVDRLTTWLANVDENIPLHLTRFFPRYRMQDRGPTSRDSMDELQKIAKRHLKTVMLGNV